jgi:hypothetical protein
MTVVPLNVNCFGISRGFDDLIQDAKRRGDHETAERLTALYWDTREKVEAIVSEPPKVAA